MTIIGIDVSSYQHPNDAPIDYQAAVNDLKARSNGQTFVLVKVTEGNTYANPYAQADIEGFKTAGAIVAGYHFMHAATPAADQIAYIKDNAHGVGKIYIDIEPVGFDGLAMAEVEDIGKALVEEFDGLYTNTNSLGQLSGAPYGKKLWLADPSNIRPDIQRQITQTGQGMVNGIVGAVDLNSYNGTAEQLQADFASVMTTQPPAASVPTPIQAPAPVPPVETTYTVVPGDTLDAIAAKVGKSVQDLQSWNDIKDPNVIKDGQILKLEAPAPAPIPQQQGVNEKMPELKENSTDIAAVKRLQALLVADGYDLGNSGQRSDGIDGGFGPLTLREVLVFQHQAQIVADGVVGPVTWGKLLGL